jgi:hypothetical protein
MQENLSGLVRPRLSWESENLHRVLLSVAFLLALSCLFLTYLGIDTYIESGRSLLGDKKTTTGYQWKGGSCDDLFTEFLPEPAPPALRDRSTEVCRIARSRDIPPMALKSVIGKALYADESSAAALTGSDLSQSFLMEVRASLVRQLPRLEQQHKWYRRTVSFMWLFFPGALGAIACFFYARRCTPVLFAIIKRRFEHIMFGRNRYSDAFDNLIKVNKKRSE